MLNTFPKSVGEIVLRARVYRRRRDLRKGLSLRVGLAEFTVKLRDDQFERNVRLFDGD